MNKIINKVSISVVSIATVLSLSGAAAVLPVTVHGAALTDAQVSAIISLLESFGADTATIANVQTSLSGGTPAAVVTSSSSSSVPASLLTSSDLTLGSKGAAVKDLQVFLNAAGHTVSTTGVGSAGNESEYFGNLTKAALAKFQAAEGISPASGYFGSISRAKLKVMSEAATTTGTTTTTTTTTGTTTAVPAGEGLTVALAASQPISTIAPGSATRIPFTKIALTAGASNVSVSSILVERTGLGSDSAIESVMLLDENGQQLGLKKTLNSDHQATIGEAFIVTAGQTRIITVAANRAAANTGTTGYSGQTLSFAVNAINTSATVTGTLPITGTSQTVNESLTIGSATMARGTIDPGASVTKEVGTEGYTFSSVRITAGSPERVYLKSIRWNQVGSAGASDLANLKTVVDGTSYDTAISSDGKYYTTIFAEPGLLMEKGGSKEVSIKGDVVGGSLRTVNFDIAKRTDIYMVGETYGYGILTTFGTGTATVANDSEVMSADDPFYDGALVTVSAGTVTASTWTGIPAGNVAINLADQVLGGWSVVVKGEEVSVSSLKVYLEVTDADAAIANWSDLTGVSLVNAAGAKLAGPMDGSATLGYINFTDTITFPIGTTNITLKGKLSTDFESSDTVQASTTPSTWTITGQTTGNTITATPASALTASEMTVKAASLNVSVSSQPTARTIISGTTKYEFARYILDGTGSGEDIRITSIPLAYGATTTASNLTNCQLYDGTAVAATSLTTGSNVKNPTAAGSSTNFIFDGTGITVTKGTSRTLSLRCDMAANASHGHDYNWGIDDAQDGVTGSYAAATGLTSGQTVAAVFTDANGQRMTTATGGSYTVAKDPSILYTTYRSGTNVILGKLKFAASTAENLTLTQIALALGNTSASSSQGDLVNEQITLHNSAGTQVGVAQFGGANARNATSTLTSAVVIPAGETTTLTLRGSLTAHTAVQGTAGSLLQIEYDGDNNGLNGNYAMGVGTVSGTSADQALNGGRIFRNAPSIAVTSTGGTFTNNADLYTFVVTNPDTSRDLILKKVSFSIATTGAADAGFKSFILYGGGIAANAAINAQDFITAGPTFDKIEIRFNATASTTEASRVPANSSKTYALRVTSYTPGTATDEISLALLADTAYAPCLRLMCAISEMDKHTDATSSNNIIWSPFSTTTPEVTAATEYNADWANGYGMSGFVANSSFPIQSWSKKNN
ncbi:peptidoglycan-binding protein [Patescibacteria group bacterium]|nr:peptidoglycan-binding protein [Patescibacteria group bacterium]